jgi:hypothetical protein
VCVDVYKYIYRRTLLSAEEMQKQSSRRRLALAGRAGGHGRLGEEETIHTHTHTQPRDTQKMASSYLVVTIKLNSTHKSSSCSSTLFFTWPSSPLYFFKTSVFIFQSGELNEKSLKKKKNKVETQKTHWKIIHETDNRVKMVPNITWGS